MYGSALSVHPRVRGEQAEQDAQMIRGCGSSPLARGEDLLTSYDTTPRTSNPRRARLSRRALATLPGMSTSYRPLITNLHHGVHCDVRSARTRLHGVIEVLEQTQFTAAVTDLRGVEQRLTDWANR